MIEAGQFLRAPDPTCHPQADLLLRIIVLLYGHAFCFGV
jgi:hypothetical protein